MPSRIGDIFGSYELIQFLGRGGFAEVYLGKHTQLSQHMAAVKILEKQLIQAKSQQFRKEASIVATLRHQNIVQMYEYNVYNNPKMTMTLIPYIVMEYATNGSLRKKHPRGLPLPLTTVVTYTRQIADALQYAHDHNVMHLDVKPENILVNGQSQLLLSDFGLATLLTEEEKTGDIQGTLSYMSPEQLSGKPDFASDQYALGIMVYEWICGYLPFTGHSVKEVIDKHLKEPPPSLRAQVNTLPQQVETVVMKALSKTTQDRYPSVNEFASALERAASSPVVAPPASPFQGAMNPLPPQGVGVPPAQSPFQGANPFPPQGVGVPPVSPNQPAAAFSPQPPMPGLFPDPGLNVGGSPFMVGTPPGAQPSPFQTTAPVSPFNTTVFGSSLGNGPGLAGPGSLPPYLGGSSNAGERISSHSFSKSISDFTVTLLNPPSLSARRRRRPSLIAGIIGDVLGAIFIAVWLGRLLPSYGNETAWWGFIFSIVISVGASYLFFNSGNKILNSGLALVLAIYWGFVGHAFAILINAGVSIPFLPDANIMSFVFFLGALFLHLYLTFTRK